MCYKQGCPDYLTPGGANSENFENSGVNSSNLMDNF
jgi:hypothetical protein